MVSPGSVFSNIQSGVSATLMGITYPLASQNPSYSFQEDKIMSIAGLTSKIVEDHVSNPKESIQRDLAYLSRHGRLADDPWDTSSDPIDRLRALDWNDLSIGEQVARSKLVNDLKWATRTSDSELASSVSTLLESELEYEKDRTPDLAKQVRKNISDYESSASPRRYWVDKAATAVTAGALFWAGNSVLSRVGVNVLSRIGASASATSSVAGLIGPP